MPGSLKKLDVDQEDPPYNDLDRRSMTFLEDLHPGWTLHKRGGSCSQWPVNDINRRSDVEYTTQCSDS